MGDDRDAVLLAPPGGFKGKRRRKRRELDLVGRDGRVRGFGSADSSESCFTSKLETPMLRTTAALLGSARAFQAETRHLDQSEHV